MRSKTRLLILLSPLFLTGMRDPFSGKSVAQQGNSASGGIRESSAAAGISALCRTGRTAGTG